MSETQTADAPAPAHNLSEEEIAARRECARLYTASFNADKAYEDLYEKIVGPILQQNPELVAAREAMEAAENAYIDHELSLEANEETGEIECLPGTDIPALWGELDVWEEGDEEDEEDDDAEGDAVPPKADTQKSDPVPV